jgi:hypothetical protein
MTVKSVLKTFHCYVPSHEVWHCGCGGGTVRTERLTRTTYCTVCTVVLYQRTAVWLSEVRKYGKYENNLGSWSETVKRHVYLPKTVTVEVNLVEVHAQFVNMSDHGRWQNISSSSFRRFNSSTVILISHKLLVRRRWKEGPKLNRQELH